MGVDSMESGRVAFENERGTARAGTSSPQSARLLCAACSAAALLATAVLVAFAGHEGRTPSELQQDGTSPLVNECSLFGCHTVRKLVVSSPRLEAEHTGRPQAMKSSLSSRGSNEVVFLANISSEADSLTKNVVATQDDDGMGAWPVREGLLKQIKEELPDDVSAACDFTVDPCSNCKVKVKVDFSVDPCVTCKVKVTFTFTFQFTSSPAARGSRRRSSPRTKPRCSSRGGPPTKG